MQVNKDITIKKFLVNLQEEGKSLVSIKNYKSDLNHFLAWATLKLKSIGSYIDSLLEITPFVNAGFFNEYKNYMVQNNIKTKTINRRLSSLRSLSHFLFSVGAIDKDFMQGIQNVGIGNPTDMRVKDQDIIEKFRESMEKDGKISSNTVKNYVSDVRSFLTWINEKGELPNGI